jgi:hypothetical protein
VPPSRRVSLRSALFRHAKYQMRPQENKRDTQNREGEKSGQKAKTGTNFPCFGPDLAFFEPDFLQPPGSCSSNKAGIEEIPWFMLCPGGWSRDADPLACRVLSKASRT